MVNPIFFFWKCAILSFFRVGKESAVITDLTTKFSYRYSKKEENSPKAYFIFFLRSIKLLFTKRKSNDKNKGEVFLVDNNSGFYNDDRFYMEALGLKQINYIFRDTLENEINFFSRVFYFFSISLTFFFLIPLFLFSKKRASVALIPVELVEVMLLAKTLKKAHCKKLIVLSAYEKEISFMCYFLKNKLSIDTYLLPSANPLSFFYKNVICNTFVFSTPFHIREFQKLKVNWFIDKQVMWPPYGFQEVQINRELNVSNENVIGLVSSGMALRRHLGHSEFNNDLDYKAEIELIGALKLILDKVKNLKVLVYFHPIEKKNESNLKFSKEFYSKMFLNHLILAPDNIPTKKALNLCNVAISGFSSAQMERLFGGFKTLFAPMGFLKNYFSDERLDAISVNSTNELEELIKKVLPLTAEEFFRKYNLNDYRWDAYPNKITF